MEQLIRAAVATYVIAADQALQRRFEVSQLSPMQHEVRAVVAVHAHDAAALGGPCR